MNWIKVFGPILLQLLQKFLDSQQGTAPGARGAAPAFASPQECDQLAAQLKSQTQGQARGAAPQAGGGGQQQCDELVAALESHDEGRIKAACVECCKAVCA